MKKKLLTLLLISFMSILPLSSMHTYKAYADVNINSNTSVNENTLKESVLKTGTFLSQKESLSEWQVPSMVRLSKITDSQKNDILSKINERIKNNYKDQYSSQLMKDILVLTALNENPQTYKNYDLVNKLLSMNDYIGSCNYEVWNLFVTTTNSYNITDENKIKIDNMVDDILSCQHENGGFSYSKDDDWIDVDMTGMALFALSNYNKKNDAINTAITNGKNYIISEFSKNDNNFDNCNTAAMALLGLSSTDYDCSLIVDNLLSFQLEDGSYVGYNTDIATEQSLYSLIQYSAAKDNKNIFNFNDKWIYTDLMNTSVKPDNNNNITIPSEENTDNNIIEPNTTVTATNTDTNIATGTASQPSDTFDNCDIIMVIILLLNSTFIIKKYEKRNING